ncbi:flagellar hook-length control protein FliK [Salinivibrio sp. ES.052]|uniref:flagellar hook-length control protein FliK n=1 Tax=Salinivibrio sp. ES.052 TaxID=1882823 RepID=UPI000928239F|nr:flagellar hook-length control protein FliK [Salinivibrio sp. ES.052]SIN75606.1 Flagellar hook-length control protein FliK [Salinivibrio sp. ES.052]
MTQSTLTLSNLSTQTPPAPNEGTPGEVKGEKNTGFLAALRQSMDGKGEQGDVPIKLTQDGKTLLVDGQAIDAEAMLADGMFSEAEMAKIADMTAMEESQSLLMRLNQAAEMLKGKSLPADAESTALSAAGLTMLQADREEKGRADTSIDHDALLAELSKSLPDEVSAEKVLEQLSPEQLAALVAQVKAEQSSHPSQGSGGALEQRPGHAIALETNGEGQAKNKALESEGAAIKWATTKAQQDNDNAAAISKDKDIMAKDMLSKEGATTLKGSELTDKLRHTAIHSDAKQGANANPNAASLLAEQRGQPNSLNKAALKAMAEQATQADALAGSSASSAGEGGTRTESLVQQLASRLGGASAQATTSRQDTQAAQNAQAPLPLGQTPTEAGAALNERINVMLSKNLKQVDIRLDPPELGRMQIKLGMNNDQATVHITVANQQARDAVEQAMPRLRDMLQQQGLQLAQGSVQQQDSGAQQMASGQQNDAGSGHTGGSSLGSKAGDDTDEAMLASQTLHVSHSDRAVDYYA